MTTVTEIEVMWELQEFLVSRYQETGHPFEQKEKNLQDDLNILTMNIRSQIASALSVSVEILPVHSPHCWGHLGRSGSGVR
jgi:hypothetical protein